MPDAKVLIVEDDGLVAEGLALTLAAAGYAVIGPAAGAAEAQRLAQAHLPDLVLMDVRLRNDDSGVDVARWMHRRFQSSVIFLTASTDPGTLREIDMDHPAEVLIKPVPPDELLETVRRVLARS